MISVSQDEILSRFAGISAVLQTLHKLHPAITCKTFHPIKTGSLFCTAGIPLCRDEIFPCNRFSPPRRDIFAEFHDFREAAIGGVLQKRCS